MGISTLPHTTLIQRRVAVTKTSNWRSCLLLWSHSQKKPRIRQILKNKYSLPAYYKAIYFFGTVCNCSIQPQPQGFCISLSDI